MKFSPQKQSGIHLKCVVVTCSLLAMLASVGITYANPNTKMEQVSKSVLQAQTLIDEYKGQGDYLEQTRELLAKAVQLDPGYAPTYVQAARLTLVGGHIVSHEFAGDTLERAEALLKKAILLEPNGSEAYVVLGHVSRLMGKYDQALLNLNKANDLKSQNPWLLNNFGAYYAGIEHIETASGYYTKVVEKGSGSNPQQRNAYIDALLKLQWFAALKDDNQNVLKFGKLATDAASPTDAWTWGNVGNVLFIQGYFDEAERHARKALSIMNYGVGQGVLALALYGKWAKAVTEGHPEQGELFFTEAYRLMPDLDDVISRFNASASFMQSFVPIVKSRQAELLAQKKT